ncbi:MAG: hypothetical protein JST92_01020 [Deltaproteobacteria bacterium]|nr:hypothetical protein [Deltaproteobacteria bacterium]
MEDRERAVGAQSEVALRELPWLARIDKRRVPPYTLEVGVAASRTGESMDIVRSATLLVCLAALACGGSSTPPPGVPSGSITIEDSKPFVGKRTVQVALQSTNATLYQLSDSPDFVNVNWAPVVASTTFTFDSDGSKTLYAKFANSAGLATSPMSASVLIDTVPPIGTVALASGLSYTFTTNIDLTLSYSDPFGSGVPGMQISNDPSFTGATWQAPSSTPSWTVLPGEGLKTVYVRFMDGAGNISAPISATIDLEQRVYTTLASGLSSPQSLVADDLAAFWIEGGALKGLGLPGQPAFQFSQNATTGTISDCALDATSVYWSDTGGVWSVPRAGGQPRQLATTSTQRVWVFDDNLYSWSGDALLAIPKTGLAPGQSPTLLASASSGLDCGFVSVSASGVHLAIVSYCVHPYDTTVSVRPDGSTSSYSFSGLDPQFRGDTLYWIDQVQGVLRRGADGVGHPDAVVPAPVADLRVTADTVGWTVPLDVNSVDLFKTRGTEAPYAIARKQDLSSFALTGSSVLWLTRGANASLMLWKAP